MEDTKIIDLYWARSEDAISQTDRKYGRLCYSIAHNVLASQQDVEESVSDTYFAAWNAMPSQRPQMLPAFLAKITRRLSIKRWRALTAEKRGGGQIELALEELEECVSSGQDAETLTMNRELYASMNRFLDALPKEERNVFLRRYFLMDPIGDIAKSFDFTESKVTSMLFRTRQKLKNHLKKEGYL